MRKIYLDYAATTPVATEVIEAMAPYFAENFGNPSSVHGFGQAARAAIDKAREFLAFFLDCSPSNEVRNDLVSRSKSFAESGCKPIAA